MPIIDAARDYYAVLGVPVDAKPEQIRQAFRELARRYHPDSEQGDATRFREIREAYELLSDRVARSSYDRQRAERGYIGTGPLGFKVLQSRKQMRPMDLTQVLYVIVDIAPRGVVAEPQQRLNLALVIDRSTSMEGARMRNVKEAAVELLGALHPQDRLALVTFSDRAEVVIPSDTAERLRHVRSAIAAIAPGGGTEILQGLRAGLQEVRRFASERSINHVILLTDGRTYGDESDALREAERAGAETISISAFGIGQDWNDAFLDGLAQRSGGVSRYIDSPMAIRTVLREQVRGLSQMAFRQMSLRLNTAPYAVVRSVHRAIPYMETLRFGDDQVVALGHLSSGEANVVAIEFGIDQQAVGLRRIARLELMGTEVATDAPIELRQDVTVEFTLQPHEEEVPTRVLHLLGRLSIYQLQEKAWRTLEAGDVHQATRYLESAATRLFDLGYRELGQAAMLEANRLSQGDDPSSEGRKRLRYGTRALSYQPDAREIWREE